MAELEVKKQVVAEQAPVANSSEKQQELLLSMINSENIDEIHSYVIAVLHVPDLFAEGCSDA